MAEFSNNFCVKIKTFKRKLKTIVDLDQDFLNSLEESTLYCFWFLFDLGLWKGPNSKWMQQNHSLLSKQDHIETVRNSW